MKTVLTILIAVVSLFGTTKADAQSKIIKLEGQNVFVGIGADRELKKGMQADIYRQAEPIIHPVTKVDLGSPRIRIGRIELKKIGPNFSSARIMEKYAPFKVGDLVEGLDVAPTPEEEMREEVSEARAEIKMLTKSLADEIRLNQKSISDLKGTLRRISGSEKRLNTLINAVRNMRERMVVMEGQIQDLETQQQIIIAQDTAEVKTLGIEDMTELKVLRRGDEESVYITVGSKTYRLSFEENMLIEEAVAQPTAGVPGGETVSRSLDLEEDLFDEDEELAEKESSILDYWWVALIVGVLGAVGMFLIKMMKRSGEEGGEDSDEDEFLEADEELDEMIPEPEEVAIEK
ncbi:MAG TPA: hypothetical protein DIU35_05520 [Candidatus Latescibacteria bacterium]|nr:hypothetical protein [Gemmatimonadota bacterium]HCR16923.1 hypothetical protein [Candidatus Latescibacterota bacterium]|tara:strand:- start:1056 stop:2096 length:1041 start_codon:yes stop_codon:yes gene_type:complete